MTTGPFMPPETPDQLHPAHDSGHPVMAGLITAAGLAALQHYATACLLRTRGPDGARLFFSQLTRRLIIAAGVGASALFTGFCAAYASIGLGFGIWVIGLIMAAVIAAPPVFRAIGCALDEISYRGQMRGSLASRITQTAHDYLPRIF